MKVLDKVLGCGILPQRYVLTFMSFLGVVIFYVVRMGLRITFTEILMYSKKNITTHPLDACSVKLLNLGDWKKEQILMTFYYGYVFGRIPGVIYIKKLGGKCILLVAAILLSTFSIIFPHAACYSTWSLITIRVSMGAAMGVFFPALVELMTKWYPRNERTLLVATVFGGCNVGVIITSMLPGCWLDMIKWQNMYVILGVVGIIWCCLWSILCYENPTSHPFISNDELDYLQKFVPEINSSTSTPWISILKSGPVWGLTIAYFGIEYGFYNIAFYLPWYYLNVSRVADSQYDSLVVLPFLLMWLTSVLLGFLCDRIIFLKWVTPTQLRRTIAIIGAVVCGLGLVIATYLPDRYSQIALIIIVLVSMSMCFCSLGVNPMDLSPNYSSIIIAISNGIGALSGLIVPTVLENILSGTSDSTCRDNSLREWQNIFWIMFAVLVLTHIPFIIYGSGEVQPWDNPKRKLSQTRHQVTIFT